MQQEYWWFAVPLQHALLTLHAVWINAKINLLYLFTHAGFVYVSVIVSSMHPMEVEFSEELVLTHNEIMCPFMK